MLFTSAPAGVEGRRGGGGNDEWFLDSSGWHAARPSSCHNQAWQNGDICRNIGYSRRHSPSQAFPLQYLPPALRATLQIVYGHWSIYFNWHFLPAPRILHLVCVIYILLLIKIHSGWQGGGKNKKNNKREQETKPWRHGSGVSTQTLYEMEMWQDITVCACVCVC